MPLDLFAGVRVSSFETAKPEGAGRALHTIFVDDLDARVADNRDADGNEIGFGGAVG